MYVCVCVCVPVEQSVGFRVVPPVASHHLLTSNSLTHSCTYILFHSSRRLYQVCVCVCVCVCGGDIFSYFCHYPAIFPPSLSFIPLLPFPNSASILPCPHKQHTPGINILNHFNSLSFSPFNLFISL